MPEDPSDLPADMVGHLTISQAAELLGVSIDTLRRWEAAGKISAHRSANGHRLFNKEEITQFAATEPLTVSEAAAFLGITPNKLRHLETQGLIKPPRDEQGNRRYTKAQLTDYQQGQITAKAGSPPARGGDRGGGSNPSSTAPPTSVQPLPHYHPSPRNVGTQKGATRLILIISALALLLLVVTRTSSLAAAVALVLLASLVSLVALKKYLPQTNTLGTLLFPGASATFAQNAPTGTSGEVLISYHAYQTLHTRLKTSAGIIALASAAALIGLKVLPVIAATLLIPVITIAGAAALFALHSLITLAPRGERINALKALVRTDPRIAFARYAPTEHTGALKVPYVTYKKLYKAAGLSLTALILLIALGLGREIYLARINADQNFKAAQTQFNAVLNTLKTGQGNLKEELQKLAAQSLQTAPTIDETSLTQRIVDQVTSNLPEAPTEIVKETTTEKTVVERTIVQTDTAQSIQLEGSGQYVVKDNRGLTIFSFGPDNHVTLEDTGIYNIEGNWYIDGTEVTATAQNLNLTQNLKNTDQGSEGTRSINTRADNFTNFSPSRNDLEAALAAIDTSLGTTSAAGAPVGATFLVLSANTTLTGERVATAGAGITLTDGGANGTLTISTNSSTITLATGVTDTDATAGSVFFAGTGGVLQQDNANFFWDDTNNRMGLGTTAPSDKLEVNGALRITRAQGANDLRIVPESSGDPVFGIYLGATRVGGVRSNGIIHFDQGLYNGILDIGPVANQQRITRSNTFNIDFSDGSNQFVFQSGHSSESAGRAAFVFDTQGSLSTSNLYSFREAGSAVMTIDHAGNVGIGTTSPAVTLDIASSTTAVNAYRASADATGSVIRMRKSRGTTTTPAVLANGDIIGILAFSSYDSTAYADTASIRAVVNDAGAGNFFLPTDLVFYTGPSSTTEKMRIMSGGNVGIGTTAPDAKLDILGAKTLAGTYDAGLVHIYDSAAMTTGVGGSIALGGKYTAAGATAVGATISTHKTNTVDGDYSFGLRFNTRNNGSAPATRMTITNEGDIAIGTSVSLTLPNGLPAGSRALSILSTNTSFGEAIILRRGGDQSTGISIWEYGGHSYIDNFENSDTSKLNFRTKAGGTPLTAMTILGSGNVGINTTAPNGALAVAGNVLVGNTAAGTGCAVCLVIAGSTAPTASITDGIQLFAVDIAGSHELRVRDEAGNVTTLSPHNFNLFQPSQDYYLPWAYTSERDNHAINVDMYGAIQEIELLSGKHFIYGRDLESGDTFTPTKLDDLLSVPAAFSEVDIKLTALESRMKNTELRIDELESLSPASPREAERSRDKGTQGGVSSDNDDPENPLESPLSGGTDDGTSLDSIFEILNSADLDINSLVIRTDATIYGTLLADTIETATAFITHGDATIWGSLLVKTDLAIEGNARVAGTLTVSNQQAGFAEIPEGGTEVKIEFSKPFDIAQGKPVVSLTPRGIPSSQWGLVDDSENGFTIKLAAPAPEPIHFTWTAFPVTEPTTTKGEQVHSDPVEEAEPVPTPHPNPLPVQGEGDDAPLLPNQGEGKDEGSTTYQLLTTN